MREKAQVQNVLANLGTLLPDLESVYKDIHSHPELSMQENRTAGIAADHLRAAGYEVTTGIGKTGVVGVLRNGDGPTIMLRADMDALPVREATLLVAFDLGGTFVFALSGATVAVKHKLDLFGVLVLSFAAGNSGGIARDVMIGAHPPGGR